MQITSFVNFLFRSNVFFFLFLLVSCGLIEIIALKNLLISFDEATQSFVPGNLFYDDLGHYISVAILTDHLDFLTNQSWFLALQEVDEAEARAQWGDFGLKLGILKPHVYDGWAWLFLAIKKIGGLTYEDAFRGTAMFFPVFVFLFFLATKTTFFCRADNYALLLVFVFVIAYGINSPVSVARAATYGYALVAMAIMIRLYSTAGRSSRMVAFFTLLAFAGYIHRLMLPVFLLFAVSDLTRVLIPRLWKKLTRFSEKWFVVICLSLLAVILAVISLSLAVKTLSTSGEFTMHMYIFGKQLRHFDWSVFASVFLVAWLSRWRPGNADIAVYKFMIVLMILSGLAISLIGSILSPVYELNSDRLVFFIYILAIAIIGYSADPRPSSPQEEVADGGNETASQPYLERRLVIPILMIASILYALPQYGAAMNVKKFKPFKEKHFPEYIAENDSPPHYLAKNPQQVWGFFMRQDFLKAPLILDFETDSYSRRKILDTLSGAKPRP